MSILSWIKREASSLEGLFHQTVQNIHNELDRLEGIAATAQAKADAHLEAAFQLNKAAGEATVLANEAKNVAAEVRKVL